MDDINKLVKFLHKKGITDVKTDDEYNNFLDVYYIKHEIKTKIRLFFYSSYVKYETPGTYLEYPVAYDKRNRIIRKSIYRLKTTFNRKDFNSAVYKNIKIIQTWIDPVAERKKIRNENLNNYTKELEYYFKDKYGNVKLDIYDRYSVKDKPIKTISATIKFKYHTETHDIRYEDGEYYLICIQKYYDNKKIYKQREKKEELTNEELTSEDLW
jgi:hypothetical protein